MKNIMILGATSAIAQETARLFSIRGDNLFLVARNKERLDAVTADLKVRGKGRVGQKECDLDQLELHQQLFDEAEAFMDGLDVVFIAHGVLGDQRKDELDWETTRRRLHTNFISVASLLTLSANYFDKLQRGSIVVITSVAGDRARQSNYIYGTAKGAVSLFLQGIRNRLARRDVTVLDVRPGFVRSPMTAHLKDGPLFTNANVIARGIVRALDARRDVVYLPGWWRLILTVVRLIPERIFKRLSL